MRIWTKIKLQLIHHVQNFAFVSTAQKDKDFVLMFTFGDLDNFQFLNSVTLLPYQLNERMGI